LLKPKINFSFRKEQHNLLTGCACLWLKLAQSSLVSHFEVLPPRDFFKMNNSS
jgi:hypothetical protein